MTRHGSTYGDFDGYTWVDFAFRKFFRNQIREWKKLSAYILINNLIC